MSMINILGYIGVGLIITLMTVVLPLVVAGIRDGLIVILASYGVVALLYLSLWAAGL